MITTVTNNWAKSPCNNFFATDDSAECAGCGWPEYDHERARKETKPMSTETGGLTLAEKIEALLTLVSGLVEESAEIKETQAEILEKLDNVNFDPDFLAAYREN